jgi:hypothetical protein
LKDIESEQRAVWSASWRGWLLVTLLMMASVMSQLDRTVINLMIEPIKSKCALNDTAVGALQGKAGREARPSASLQVSVSLGPELSRQKSG